MTNEQKAIATGNSKTNLKRRLLDAKTVLVNDLQKQFSKHSFDFERKRLYSHDRKLYLQWLLRPKPLLPESYENQQTSVGCVVVRRTERN